MNNNKIIGIILLEMTEAFTGQYSDQTMLYLIGGAVAAIAGLVMLFRK